LTARLADGNRPPQRVMTRYKYERHIGRRGREYCAHRTAAERPQLPPPSRGCAESEMKPGRGDVYESPLHDGLYKRGVSADEICMCR